MTSFPGWFPDPTGRHPERYFDGEGLPTQLVRNDGLEFIDVGPSATTGESEALPPSRTTPLASYRAPAGDAYLWTEPQGTRTSGARPTPPVVEFRRRPWWLIGALCLASLLLIASIVAVFQQHGESDRWQGKYRAETTKYQAEVRKNITLYATLVTTLQELSAATNKNTTP
jgi:Protein of unknown function (DUF2510)